jgi:hypothetical protein
VAAPTFFAASALFAANSGTSITPVIPASCVANDIMVFVGMCNVASDLTKPSDYTSMNGSPRNAAAQSTMLCWKRHTGSESNPTATSSTTGSTTAGLYGRLYVFRGCLTGATPFENQFAENELSGTTSSNTLSATMSSQLTNDLLGAVIAIVDDDNSWSSGWPPSGYADIGGILTSSVGGDCMMDACAKTFATPASINVGSMVMSAADNWSTAQFFLLPVVAAALQPQPIIAPSQAVHRSRNW